MDNTRYEFRAFPKYGTGGFVYFTFGDSKMPSNWKDWYTVQQCTGITDKEGNKIFEGDLVKYNKPSVCPYDSFDNDYVDILILKVDWGYRGWVLTGQLEPEPMPNKHMLKVVGNIFETPELIKINL